MAITTRQNSLLVAEDWKKIYQTFKEADFQSYDFETLRKSMIDYLRIYYPEDFNDFIESSEFISLIDLIAFLGQGLAFRTDLNARENFIDTAERRDSILKLARLINYTPKRNNTASGLLKIVGVRTTESIFDSDGVNLSGVTINWNDRSNGNWQEQFITVVNAALINSQRVGRPGNSAMVSNIKTDEYQLSLASSTTSPVFPFSATVEGISMNFEMVGASSINSLTLYETDPAPGENFNILYRTDKLGNNSVNTGFFMHFKQGKLEKRNIVISESLPNRVVSVNISNINNTDVWLYKLDSSGNPIELWTKVPAITGNNVAYNTLSNTNRKLYQVNTRANDQIDLIFGDGVFSEIPQGNFAVYFRVSAGTTYKISPDEMQAISIDVNYTNRQGRVETLTLTGSLQYTVTNSSAKETLDEIRQRAPQQYYTQNRIVTGEDYNVFPFAAYNNIIKVKAVNRTSSGISRYFDVIDTTGKYSSTNIYSDDGWFYREDGEGTFSFVFSNNNDIIRVIREQLSKALKSKEQVNFYYENFTSFPMTSEVFWQSSTVSTNQTTGYFKDLSGSPLQVGTYVLDNKKYIRPGSILKVSAPPGQFFDSNNYLKTGIPSKEGDRVYFYTSVVSVIDDGTNQGQGEFDTGLGPVAINEIVPTGSIIESVFPAFSNTLSSTIEQQILENVSLFREFGIRYDQESQGYAIIDSEDLNTVDDFSLSNAGDITGQALDSSWIARFGTDGQMYTVIYRKLDFVFESKKQTRFYFDNSVRVYDPRTGSIVTDAVKILKINHLPDNLATGLGYDYSMQIHNVFIESDGYEDTTKIKVTYPDFDQDGVPDNIDVFKLVVAPNVNPDRKYVFFQSVIDSYGYSRFEPVDGGVIIDDYQTLVELDSVKNLFNEGQLFFVTTERKFYELTIDGVSRTLVERTDFRYRVGRGNLYFQYKHNSPNSRRIDPSPNNIIDLYILTRNYDTSFRAWIQDSTGKVLRPNPPSSDELAVEFADLENYKPISDALLFSSAKFKMLFGDKADENLRATFKVVKSVNSVVSDSEIKSRMVEAINTYFELGNWDFGDTFYFSELSTYLHTALSPNVSSIVLVPENGQQAFGSLYQINCNPDEIFISAATVDNIDIIPAVTAVQLNQI